MQSPDEIKRNLKLVSEAFGRYAKGYYDKYSDVQEYRKSLDLIVDQIQASGSLLDMACGPANLSYYVVSKRPDIEISLVDAAPEMLQLAIQSIPKAKVIHSDIRNIAMGNAFFDAILLGFGLPYLNLTEAKQCIRDCKDKLKNAGLFYISFMEGAYQDSRIVPSSDGRNGLMTYFYSEEQIIQLLEEAGFIILNRDKIERESSCDVVLLAKANLSNL